MIGIRASLSLASPPPKPSSAIIKTNEPCLAISKIVADSSDKDVPSVDPQLAYDCLLSVPLDVKKGLKQLDGIKQLLEFQSTLSYLKGNDSGSLYPPVDLMGGVDKLASQLSAGYFFNEYDFQIAISHLFASAHDGHLFYTPRILDVLSLIRPFPLISLSCSIQGTMVGYEEPQIFACKDLPLLFQRDNREMRSNAPAVVSIYETPVESFLKDQADLLGEFQDPAANYNAFFVNIPWMQADPGSSFTAVSRYKLSRPDFMDMFVDNANTQSFAAENITILQDGLCSSTCALFSEAMKSHAGVRQVVYEGQPQRGPMQAVGGVQGSEFWSGPRLLEILEEAYSGAEPELRKMWNNKLGTQPNANLTLAVNLASGVGINVRNQVREGEALWLFESFISVRCIR